MDLGTIEKKLEARAYHHPGEFVDDMRLVWANARRYNPQMTIVHQAATHFRNVFERNLHMQVNPGTTPPPAVMAAAAAPAPSLKPPFPAKTYPPAPARAPAPPPPAAAAAAPAAPPPAPPPPAAAPAPPPPAAPAAPKQPAPAPPAPPREVKFDVPSSAASGSAAGSSSNGAGLGNAAFPTATAPQFDVAVQGAEYVTQVYSKVVRILRQQQAAKYFREPVDWQKLKLWNYLEIVTSPMDLQTCLRKLDRREYADVASLRHDVDLIWDNAVLYNGENSWIKKYVDAMRSISARKFAEVAARPPGLLRKPAAAPRPSLPSGTSRGVGNVPCAVGVAYFITPQMRLGLLENSIKLRDEERVSLVRMAQQLCPNGVESIADGRETKIDVDALDPKTFLRLDTHVRRSLVAAKARPLPGHASTHML